jgi:glycosyltransferase involved in cell wall biosynthesis
VPGDYFMWVVSTAHHENHLCALDALEEYYGTHGGKLTVAVAGYDSTKLDPRLGPLAAKVPEHVEAARRKLESSRLISEKMVVLGYLPDAAFAATLAGAKFLWHPNLYDNGTFVALEAACHGTPTVSSDYPQMRTMDSTFGLHLLFADPRSPGDMARKLKQMETQHEQHRQALPARERLDGFASPRLARQFWDLVGAGQAP